MAATTMEVFAGRDVAVWFQGWNSGNGFPGDNAWGHDYSGNGYTNAGWTKDGVAIRWRQQIQDYMVDQFLDPLTSLPLSRDLRFVSSIAALDWWNLVAATSSGSATGTTPPGSGNSDFTLNGASENYYYTVFFDIRNPISNDFAHLVGWRCRGVGDIEMRIHLPDVAQMNMEMRAFPDTSQNPARIAQFRLQSG